LLPIILAVGAVAVGPVMGFCIPWRAWLSQGSGQAPTIRVLTCNVEADYRDPAPLGGLVLSASPDIAVIQEWYWRYDPASVFPGPNWHIRIEGEYGIASRYPILEVESFRPTPPRHAAARFTLQTPTGILHVVSLHPISVRNGLAALIENPLGGGSALAGNIADRWLESLLISQWISRLQGPVLVAGDFNLPCDSAIFRDCWSRYSDAFTEGGLGFGYTRFTNLHGIRIDHILVNSSWRVHRCWVGPDVGSDHLPLIADLGRVTK
jgi:vancomycin resistance protein VanJ